MNATTSYRPELDGIRAFCILITLANHTHGAPFFINGTVGVDIFFALSGWLITRLLIEEYGRYSDINLLGYYIRRIFRIVPLYYCTIALYGIAVLVVLRWKNDTNDLLEFKAALPWITTFNSEYRSDEAGNIFGHAWTIGIEEKFYIIWPLFLYAALRGRRWTIAFLPLVIIALFSINPQKFAFLSRGYFGLSFGAALAAFSTLPAFSLVLGRASTAYWALTSVLLIYILSLVYHHEYAWNIAISFSASFLVGSLWTCRGTKIAHFLSIKPLPYIGKLTYSIYLIHVLVINTVLVIATKTFGSSSFVVLFFMSYAACLVVCSMFYFGVERPFISLGRHFSRRVNSKKSEISSAEVT